MFGNLLLLYEQTLWDWKNGHAARRPQARFYYVLGLTYRFYGVRTGQRRFFERSDRALSRALVFDPAFQAAYYQRGLLYWREMHLSDRAVQDFTAALESFSEALFMRAMAYEQLGDYQAAAEDLEAFLAQYPNSKWVNNAARQLELLRAILEEMPPLLNSSHDFLP